MNILINALGIQDSGGITVLRKMLNEIILENGNRYTVFIFDNKNTVILVNEFIEYKHVNFKFIENKGLIFRILFENLYFFSYTKKNKIDLVYNFSGTSQFLSRTKQLIKVHNLLFYSKRLDQVYFKNKKYLKWIKQIFIKRILLKLMLRKIEYIEIQSSHVKNNLADFIDTTKKVFFIKSDILISNNKKIVNYDMTKEINFLYVVGPHFSMPHKNIDDFILTMCLLHEKKVDFKINITLDKSDLVNYKGWNNCLNDKTNFLGYLTKKEIDKLFVDNTILISTSIVETLGLHVIESIMNGILCIVPGELYAKSVYGENINKYNLFDKKSLVEEIMGMTLLNDNKIRNIISSVQKYINENECKKYKDINSIFEKIIKG